MAIESSLTQGVAKTGENKKSQLDWPSPDLSRGSYLGDSDSESTSVTSSVFGSTSSATSSLDHESSNIKEGTGRKKTLNKSNSKKLATFGSFMSSRRRAQSRLSQPSTSSPDDGSTSQRHRSMLEVSDASPDYVQKPMPKFTRTGSLRTLRIFKNKSKSSIKSKKPLTGRSLEISEELCLERATFSSTLKDSKFPEQLEPEGGPVESQEVFPVAKFCPYQHCSLHGHHHHHEPPAKRFPYLKRRSSKYQKSMNPESQFSAAEKRSVRKSDVKVTKKVSKREPDTLGETKGHQSNSRDDKDDGDFSIEFYAKTRSEPHIGASHTHDDADFADILFGVKSFQDNQNEVGNFRMEDQDSSAFNIDMKSEELTVSNLEDLIDTEDGKKGNPDGSTCVEANKPAFKKGNHLSMWRMIHRHMVSGLAAEPGNEQQVDEENQSCVEDAGTLPETKDFDNTTVNDDAVSQETEIRKMFAIKLVREAIEKILLPEVQDDQSTTSEVISEQDLSEKNHGGEAITVPPPMTDPKEGTQAANDGSEPRGESVEVMVEKKAEEMVEKKTEKRAPKSWSYLKKVILLRRFVKELEKVKKFNPRKPRHLPLVPEPEAETVSLRRQTVGEKKNSDEWMLDYALRQVVSELAPTQKRKVALLVKAFETVAPTHEDQSVKEMSPKFSNSTGKESSLNDKLQRVSSHVKNSFQKANEASTGSRTDSDTKSKAAANTEASSIADSSEQLNEAGNGKKNERKLDVGAKREGGNQLHVEKHIKMWHMIYQHVATDIATKVGSELLLDGEESVEGEEKNLQEVEHQTVSNYRLGFTQSDVVKLVRESVDEILLPEVQDDSSPDTRSVASDISSEQELVEKNKDDDGELRKVEKDFDATANQKPTDEGAAVTVTTKLEQQKSKNWNKLKKLIMLKRSIKALESFRKLKPQVPQQLAAASGPEGERVDLRRQMMDERKKAEQWMLDYAVQHIVTKLTPARKRRVAMLVEAFEAAVPLPEI